MTTLDITIDLNNDAFQGDNWPDEVARILSQLANEIRSRRFHDGMNLRDINGNCVGRMTADE